MTDKENYINAIEENLKNYKHKVSQLEKLLANYQSADRDHLLSESHGLKEALKKGEELLKKLKFSSEENYEELQNSLTKAFDTLQANFRDLLNSFTMEKILQTKTEITDFGCEHMDKLEGYIKQHPLLTTTCALGIGFLIGTLCRPGK
ncbi:MAG: hypothetical protein K2W92_06130 [Alphaproteobacteria bacterium]|nr:hypothetical protein [Alphaproteobacteria bacterium]